MSKVTRTYTDFGFAVMLNDSANGAIPAGTLMLAMTNNAASRIKATASAKTYKFYVHSKTPLTKEAGMKRLNNLFKTKEQAIVLDKYLESL